MGYCITQISIDVEIKVPFVAKALSAINALHDETILGMNAQGGAYGENDGVPVRERRWYSWVRNPEGPSGFTSLPEALRAWRYASAVNEDGDVRITHFTGEKLGQDDILFEVLAPFVGVGHVAFQGEDGAFIAFNIENGRLA